MLNSPQFFNINLYSLIMPNWDEYKKRGYLSEELIKKHKDFYTNLFKLNKLNTKKNNSNIIWSRSWNV